jgi:predicted transcriptional regulator
MSTKENVPVRFLLTLLFKKGDVNPMIGNENRLIKTNAHPNIANMNENFGVKIGYGTVYPLLKSLRAKAFIKSRSKIGERRKIYEITLKGRKVINLYTELLKEQLQLLETES